MRSFLIVVLASTLAVAAAAPQQEETAATAIKGHATTVLVDVVVRDDKGRPLPGLKASDFEVYEDGARQNVTFFQGIRQPAASPTGSTADSPLPAETPGGNVPSTRSVPSVAQASQGDFTAIVFDRLSQEGRSLAREAALAYVSKIASDSSWIGVFVTDRALRTIQFFTRDRTRLEAAIRTAAGATIAWEEPLEQQIAEAESAMGDGGGGAGPPDVDSLLAAVKYRLSESTDRLQRDQLGYASADGLLSIVGSLNVLPGRKSILYFSEGLLIPPAVEKRFRSVIGAANRSGVSIYTIDAAGLRAHSTAEASQSWVGAGPGAAQGRSGRRRSRGIEGVTDGPLTREVLEKNEDILRSDAHSGLTALADQTGGLFIRGTNDLTAGLRQIEQDMHYYYLLAYTPTDPEMDGRFRTIQVKVNVAGVEVQYRKGYYAVGTNFDEPVLEYEGPALAILENRETPASLDLQAGVLSFPKPDAAGLVTVLAELPPEQLAYRPEKALEITDLSLVAVVRDASGHVARKVSQHYELGRKPGAAPGADGILFYRELHLHPGQYTVAIAAFDAISGKAGVRRVGLVIPAADPALPGLSSLMLVQSAEEVGSGDRAARTPFYYGTLLLYPDLSHRLSKTDRKELTFFFTVYPGGKPPTEAFLEVRRLNQKLDEKRIELPAPDRQGRIQLVSTLPLANYPPGTYTLQVLVPAGDRLVSRSARFLLMP